MLEIFYNLNLKMHHFQALNNQLFSLSKKNSNIKKPKYHKINIDIMDYLTCKCDFLDIFIFKKIDKA